MSFTLQGSPLQSAIVRIQRFGVPSADVSTVDVLDLAVGTRVTLAVGDLSLTMSVASGGTFAGRSSYTLLGGAGKWSVPVPRKGHRSDQGITVTEVARDLATDADEIGVVIEPGAERPLGYAWERRAGVASDALDQLVGDAWWIASDGMTHVGARSSRAISPPTLTVQHYDPATRRATVALEDDACAQLLPGAVLTASGLPAPLDVGGCVLRVEGGTLEVDLTGERPPSELLAAVVRLLLGREKGAAPQLYQVDSDGQGRTTAHAAGPSAASLPDQLGIDRCYGVPGVTADLAPGALVAVVCLDGSPGSPRVALYLPGTDPVTVKITASTSLAFVAPAVSLGGPPGSGSPVVVDAFGLFSAWVTAVTAQLSALGHPVTAPLGFASTTTTAVP